MIGVIVVEQPQFFDAEVGRLVTVDAPQRPRWEVCREPAPPVVVLEADLEVGVDIRLVLELEPAPALAEVDLDEDDTLLLLDLGE